MTADKTKKTEDSLDFPRFASLSRAILVDSRADVRDELLRSLKASLLFEELLQSASLVNIAAKLQSLEFDACIFGPSLDPVQIANFVERQADLVLSKDCAFIAISEEGKARAIRARCKKLHTAVSWPCTKRKFTEGLIKGILLANEGTLWPGVKLSEDGQVMIHRAGQWLDYGEVIVEEVEGDEALSSDNTSEPGPLAHSQVEKILLRLIHHIDERREEDGPVDEFTLFFENCVKEWLAEKTFESPAEALKNLRRRILSYANSE